MNLWYVFIDMEGDFVPSGRHYFDMNHREKLEGPRGVRYRLEIVAPTAMDAEVIGLLAAGEKGELYAIYYAGVKPTS